MVKETSHSRAAAALAEDIGKRLHILDRSIGKKAVKDRHLRAPMEDLDPVVARLRAMIIWMDAKNGELPKDDVDLKPAVRAQIEVFRKRDVTIMAGLLEEWIWKEKNTAEYLSSPAAANLSPDERACYERSLRFRKKTVRELEDERAQLLQLLRP